MSTPLNEGKSVAQKLHENLTWMRANGASNEEQKAEIAKAQAALDRQSATEQAGIGKPGVVQKAAEAVVSGFPGASRAVAGYRGALSALGVGNETPDEALTSQRENVASLSGKARIPLQLLGGAPAAVLAAPLGVIGGGAAMGAAMGADDPAESLGERGSNTIKGGVGGAVVGGALRLGGRGVANISNRLGLTDKVEQLVQRVKPELAAAMGTRGQVNNAFADRQDILRAVGDNGIPAAQKQIDRIAATKAKAGELYGIAKQDTKAITDPRVTELLGDPQIAKAMEAVSSIRKASGAPLPVAADGGVPEAFANLGVTPEKYARSLELAKQRGIQNTGADLLSAKEGGAELPDPDALAKLKRYLYDAAQGRQDSPLNIKQDEARALIPKVDKIRSVLHEISPAWKEADAFYSDAKGQEEAFAHGFDAFKVSLNPSGEQLPTHTAEAMMKSLSEPRYPNEPAEAMASRVEAFRDGIRSAMGKGVRGSVVDEKARTALSTTPLAGDAETQQVRGIGFANPAQRQAMESLLAQKRGAAMSTPRDVNVPESALAYHAGRIREAINAMVRAPNRLGTPLGQDLIQQRQANPALMSSELAKAKAGETLSDYLTRLSGVAGAGQIVR